MKTGNIQRYSIDVEYVVVTYKHDGTCPHCGGEIFDYEMDFEVGREMWSPITCDSCNNSYFEVRRGGVLKRLMKITAS